MFYIKLKQFLNNTLCLNSKLRIAIKNCGYAGISCNDTGNDLAYGKPSKTSPRRFKDPGLRGCLLIDSTY